MPVTGGRPDQSVRRLVTRTCIGCRRRAEASDLVRLVAQQRADGPEIVVDRARNLPGRGAWLHPAAECVTAAVRRRAFASALRVPGLSVNPNDLTEKLGAAATDSWPSRGPEQVAEDMSTP
ncbi:YlxR family protein [Gordonia sp. ABSL1-1]|nr:YlxR family protein [Gordonia sp. ABSL1-1]MDL9936301.1 YlxR family protein [Gordonia sp. ABSL1-1]